jgi:hypothetical protein
MAMGTGTPHCTTAPRGSAIAVRPGFDVQKTAGDGAATPASGS